MFLPTWGLQEINYDKEAGMIGIKKENKKDIIKKKNLNLDLGILSVLLLLLFRIPIANIIGNEGNGYLAFTWELYLVAAIFFGHSFYAIMKDMVRKRIQKNQYRNSVRVLSTGIIFSSVLALIGGGLIFICSDFLFRDFYHLKEAALSLKIFSFHLIISTISGCIRGYFEGIGSRVPTYFSTILESFISGISAILFSYFFTSYGDKVAALLFNQQYKPGFGATGVVCGLLCGSIFSLIFLLIIYRIYQIPFKELLKKDETKVFEKTGHLMKEIFITSAIVILPILFFKGYRLLNLTIYLKGFETENLLQGLKYIGSYYGKSIVFVLICSFFILGVTDQNIKRMKKAYTNHRLNLVRRYYIEDIKKLVILSISITILLIFAGEYLLQLIYHSSQKYEIIMLQIASINVIVITIANYGYFLLASLNKNVQITIIFAISFLVQTGMMFVLQKTKFVTYSLVLAEVIFWLTVMILNSLYLYKVLEFRPGRNQLNKSGS